MAITIQQFLQNLRKLKTELPNAPATDVLSEAAGIFHDSVKANFARQEDEFGNHWPPRKDKKQHPLLVLTSQLLNAAGGGAGENQVIQGGRKIILEIDSPEYAAVHQFGKGKVPRRSFFYLHRSDKGRMDELVKKRFSEIIRGLLR